MRNSHSGTRIVHFIILLIFFVEVSCSIITLCVLSHQRLLNMDKYDPKFFELLDKLEKILALIIEELESNNNNIGENQHLETRNEPVNNPTNGNVQQSELSSNENEQPQSRNGSQKRTAPSPDSPPVEKKPGRPKRAKKK